MHKEKHKTKVIAQEKQRNAHKRTAAILINRLLSFKKRKYVLNTNF